MAEGWARIWTFLARHELITPERAKQLCKPEALEEHTLLPQTRRIRKLAMTREETERHRMAGTLDKEVMTRAATIGGLLHLTDEPADLKPSQRAIIAATAQGLNVLGLLPTGFGKSFCFQLPALVLPGVTVVVSPLVALMHDQALELNRSIGGAVRALVAPLRESSSRAGKTEVTDQLLDRRDHGIRLVYVSPERLCQRRFREVVRDAVASGIVTRIALDEAHTFVQWDDFRPSMSRVEHFIAELRRDFGLPVTALTATANRTVHSGLREGVFGLPTEIPGGVAGEAAEARTGTLLTVRENPVRPELAIFRRKIQSAGPAIIAGLAEEVLDAVEDHTIFYCLTVKDVVSLHAHLREYLGEAGVRVRRFHGRLTEVEKSSVRPTASDRGVFLGRPAQLLQHRVHVGEPPVPGDLAVDHAHRVDPRHGHRPAGRREAEEVAAVGAAKELERRHQAAVGGLPADLRGEVGEGLAEGAVQVADGRLVGGHTGLLGVVDEVVGEDLLKNGEVTGPLDLLDVTPDNGNGGVLFWCTGHVALLAGRSRRASARQLAAGRDSGHGTTHHPGPSRPVDPPVYGPEELLGIASAAGREFDVAADDERRGSIEAQIGSESHASDRAALGGDAAAGGSLDFPRRAKAAFTYAGGSNSEVSEELYSDTEATLSQGTGRILRRHDVMPLVPGCRRQHTDRHRHAADGRAPAR